MSRTCFLDGVYTSYFRGKSIRLPRLSPYNVAAGGMDPISPFRV